MFLFFIILSIYVPNNIINVYEKIVQYISVCFLLVNLLILIDFGYDFNSKLISYHSPCWKISNVTISIGLYVSMITMVCIMYESVIYGVIIIVTNFGVTLLSLSPFSEDGNLLTSSIICFQLSYFYVIGMHNHISNGFFTALSLTYNAYSTSKYDQKNNNEFLDLPLQIDEKNSVIIQKPKQHNIKKYVYYCFVLSLSSIYIPIILIGFKDPYYFIVFSQMFGYMLYVWVLIAQYVFPNRIFTKI